MIEIGPTYHKSIHDQTHPPFTSLHIHQYTLTLTHTQTQTHPQYKLNTQLQSEPKPNADDSVNARQTTKHTIKQINKQKLIIFLQTLRALTKYPIDCVCGWVDVCVPYLPLYKYEFSLKIYDCRGFSLLLR